MRSLSIALVLATLITPLRAQAFSWSGQLRSSTDSYSYHLRPPTKDVSPYLTLEAQTKNKWRKSLRFQSKLSVLSNPLSQGSPEQFYVDLPEGFLEYKSSELKLRAGMDVVNWGMVDVSSPSDVVNSTAIFHPLRSPHRGAPMLEAIWDQETFGLHAIYIPIQQRPLLPSVDSRWLPRQLLLNLEVENNRIALPETMEYRFDAPENLDRALNNNFGFKFSSHLDRLDLQLIHFEGVFSTAQVRGTKIQLEAATNPLRLVSPLHLSAVAFRVRETGVGLAWATDEFIVRAESVYQHTISEDPILQPWRWSNVLAFESKLDVGTSTINWLAQFYYYVNPRAADNFISSSYRLFDRTILFGARWNYSDDLLIQASALYETQQSGLFAMLGFEQKLTEVMKWGMSWRDFSAGREGLLKTFERNDHANLDLIYYF